MSNARGVIGETATRIAALCAAHEADVITTSYAHEFHGKLIQLGYTEPDQIVEEVAKLLQERFPLPDPPPVSEWTDDAT